jgi:hypothetical protein
MRTLRLLPHGLPCVAQRRRLLRRRISAPQLAAPGIEAARVVVMTLQQYGKLHCGCLVGPAAGSSI